MLVYLSSLKTNLISLNSLRSWVLSTHSEVLAYYTIEAVPSTQWRKFIGFRLAYMASNGSLCSAFHFFSQNINTSLLISIPYVVGFSVRAQRCLLTIPLKGFLPYSRENLLGYELHIWPPMAVFVQPCIFFLKENTTSLLLWIPYLVWFSVRAQRCLLTHGLLNRLLGTSIKKSLAYYTV